MLNAGEKNEAITIVRDTIAQSTDDGSEVRTENTVATRWATIKPVTGREFFAAQATQSRVSYRVTIDYLADAAEQDRVVWAAMSLTLQVVAVLHNASEWTTVLMCEVRHVS